MFASIVILTITIAAFGPMATSDGAPSTWSLAILVLIIAVLGIPHGAVDHLVAGRLDREQSVSIHAAAGSARWSFALRYVGAMVGYGVVWLVAPWCALAVFLLLAIHHFGQSDLAYLRLPVRRQLALQWSRGAFLIGAPLIGNLDAVGPVIQRMGGGQPDSWPWLADHWQIWFAALIAQHLIVGGVVALRADNPAAVRREALTVGVLALLFLRTDPLLGFAVYFGLWHSVAHLLVLMELLGPDGSSPRALRVSEFARLAAPRSVIALAATALLAGSALAMNRADLLLPAIFVMVSLLTLPHMVVVEQLWRRRGGVPQAVS